MVPLWEFNSGLLPNTTTAGGLAGKLFFTLAAFENVPNIPHKEITMNGTLDPIAARQAPTGIPATKETLAKHEALIESLKEAGE